MKTLIKKILNVSSEGVSFTLAGNASLDGGLPAEQWYVSWDKIGRALLKEQYSDTVDVEYLRIERGEKE